MRDLSLVRFILLRLGLPIPRRVTLMSLDKLLTFEQSTIYYFGDWGSHSPVTCEEEDCLCPHNRRGSATTKAPKLFRVTGPPSRDGGCPQELSRLLEICHRDTFERRFCDSLKRSASNQLTGFTEREGSSNAPLGAQRSCSPPMQTPIHLTVAGLILDILKRSGR
jgi:hypothetical protein